MRILVDTSVWVDFLNGHPSPERATLANLLANDHDLCTCGVVIAEVFQGLRRDKGRDQLARSFKELIYLDPSGVDLYFGPPKSSGCCGHGVSQSAPRSTA